MLQVLGEADVDCSSVHEAVACNHSGCLHVLLQQPGGVAAVLQLDENQHTCLHQVQHFTVYCTNITAALLRGLTQQQQLTAVINRTDSSGHTALRRTIIKQGDSTRVCHGCMRLLLAAGADIIDYEWQPDILAEVISETTMYDDSSNDAELTVQALVQRGLDVEQRDSEGLTRLQQLAQYLNAHSVSTARSATVAAAMRALLANGADGMATDRNGNTALHILVNSYHVKYERFLRADEHLRCSSEAAIQTIYDSVGAECLAATMSDGDTPLHLTVRWPGYVQLLIKLGANVHAQDHCEMTPLHYAAFHGVQLSVQLLLDAGADVAAINIRGEQPLHVAARRRELQICRLLLDRGADVNAITDSADSTFSGFSVTMCALQLCDCAEDRWLQTTLRCLKLLVEAGAEVQQCSEQRGTLLHISATSKCAAVTQYLLDKLLPQHPDVMNRTNEHGQTPLSCAAAFNNAAVVKLLLASGASVNIDSSPLLHACFSSRESDTAADLVVFNLLLDARISFMQLGTAGETLLHTGARHGKTHFAQLLASKGISVNAINHPFGETALHLACAFGNTAYAEALLDNGADVNTVMSTGATPAFMAAIHGSTECLQLLAERGADLSIRDEAGHTLLHAAVAWGHPQCVTLY
eukprot:3501-Heterococcus_DN1.PRE.3